MSTLNPDTRRPSAPQDRGRATSRPGLAAAIAALLLVGPVTPASASLEVSGVAFAPAHRVADDVPLELTGLGLHRYRRIFKLYAMALYMEPSAATAELTPEIVLEDVSKRLELESFLSIPASRFRKLTRERIGRAVSPAEYARLEPAIEAMNALYEDLGAGDRYAITYVPGRGTELAKNGVSLGVVPGARFARAMFGIWLGDDPFDRRLRAQLMEDPE